MIKIYCGKTRSKLLQLERVVAGSVGIPVEFSFSDDWKGLEKTAVFRGKATREKVLPGTITTVAPEAVEEPGYELQIGVYGKSQDGQIVMPTTWTTVCLIEEGCIDPNAEESKEPTPSVVAQIQAMAEAAASNTEGAMAAARDAVTEAAEAKTTAEKAVQIATAEGTSAYASAKAAMNAEKAAKLSEQEAGEKAKAAANEKEAAEAARAETDKARLEAVKAKEEADTAKAAAEAESDRAEAKAEQAKRSAAEAAGSAVSASAASGEAKRSSTEAIAAANRAEGYSANAEVYAETAQEAAEEARQHAEESVSLTPRVEALESGKADQATLDEEIQRATAAEALKADQENTYTKQEVDTKVAQATPSDYASVKEQLNENTDDIAELNREMAGAAEVVGQHSAEIVTLRNEKISKPADAPEVGKVLKIKSVNPDGTFTCEWADAPSGGVEDVQVGGSSVVADGVATIPLASNKEIGAMKIGDASLYTFGDGRVIVNSASEANIKSRLAQRPIPANRIDHAVKAAMCDGKGAAWSDTEQAAARERIGVGGKFELIEIVDVPEDSLQIIRTAEPNGTPYKFRKLFFDFFRVGNGTSPNYFYYGTGDKHQWLNYIASFTITSQSDFFVRCSIDCENGAMLPSLSNYYFSLAGTYEQKTARLNVDTITSINIRLGQATTGGAKIAIYGLR